MVWSLRCVPSPRPFSYPILYSITHSWHQRCKFLLVHSYLILICFSADHFSNLVHYCVFLPSSIHSQTLLNILTQSCESLIISPNWEWSGSAFFCVITFSALGKNQEGWLVKKAHGETDVWCVVWEWDRSSTSKKANQCYQTVTNESPRDL